MAQRQIIRTIKDPFSSKTAKIGTWVGLPDGYQIPEKGKTVQIVSRALKRNLAGAATRYSRKKLA